MAIDRNENPDFDPNLTTVSTPQTLFQLPEKAGVGTRLWEGFKGALKSGFGTAVLSGAGGAAIGAATGAVAGTDGLLSTNEFESMESFKDLKVENPELAQNMSERYAEVVNALDTDAKIAGASAGGGAIAGAAAGALGGATYGAAKGTLWADKIRKERAIDQAIDQSVSI